MTWLPQADEGSDMVRRKLIARPRLCGQATALFGQLDEHTPAVPTLEPLLSRGRPEHVAGPLEPRPVPAGHPHLRVEIEGLEDGLAEAVPLRRAEAVAIATRWISPRRLGTWDRPR
jgi:hypothetical protein